ncbi:hypothetical protein D0Z07_0991 [Hyphodiscus hymeniophilus]|uniref:Uncharacterized protein n=1 Tax=Hyphodiscus hymeniophilus TaxID=353542 RepID=A0A9P6VRQ9_9HELO|nr:hypothetical protein D0Z07_0991 [Hyphodiscus hymeniophilus]
MRNATSFKIISICSTSTAFPLEHSSSRFVQISEAYAILRVPAKRQEYDREHLLNHHSPSQAHSHRPRGSYHSSGPVGGRPASGLSRRRSQFRGPPPSFYRSGGWGDQAEKRQNAQDATGETRAGFGDKKKDDSSTGMGGMGPGQQPWGHERNDVPHFDRDGHFRTHENYDQRRRQRINHDSVPRGETRGMFANFLFVGGIISLGVFIPSLIFERLTKKAKVEKA